MEILDNFSSIYCFIAFVIGAVFMFIAVCVVAMGKVKEPKNKVRFFIKNIKGVLYLNIRNKERSYLLCGNVNFHEWGLNPADFSDMKIGEIREVFINLED